MELVEIPDWNCCGASSAHSLNHFLSVALPARTLGIAEDMGLDVASPCAACYNRLKSAEVELKADSELRGRINESLEKPYDGKIGVKSLLEAFYTPEIIEKTRELSTYKLNGLRPACYYGCLLVRPAKVTRFDDCEDPQSMDELMKACGAEPVEWFFKTDCCGTNLTMSKSEMVAKMTGEIIRNAKAQGANCIVTACPLCATNLEMRQEAGGKLLGEDLSMPVFFFTELMGLAFNVAWIRKCFA